MTVIQPLHPLQPLPVADAEAASDIVAVPPARRSSPTRARRRWWAQLVMGVHDTPTARALSDQWSSVPHR